MLASATATAAMAALNRSSMFVPTVTNVEEVGQARADERRHQGQDDADTLFAMPTIIGEQGGACAAMRDGDAGRCPSVEGLAAGVP